MPTWIRYDSATMRARELRLSFISLISLSTSSMNLSRNVVRMPGIYGQRRTTG